MNMYRVSHCEVSRTIEASSAHVARRLFEVWHHAHHGEINPLNIAVVDREIAFTAAVISDEDEQMPHVELCMPVHQVNESVWARIQQEELDKVHTIWCRRAGDKGAR